MSANQRSSNSADQYFELEVTPPNEEPVYSYLRLGTWGDDPNSGAAQMRGLQQAASQVAETGDATTLIQRLSAISGTEGDDEAASLRSTLASSAQARNQARTARNTALTAYERQRGPYTTAASEAGTAHAEMVRWRDAYNNWSGDPQGKRQILARYNQEKANYDQKKAALDAVEPGMTSAREALETANNAYQQSKAGLYEAINAAVAQAQSTLIEAATSSEPDRKRGHDLSMRVVDFFDDTRNRGGPRGGDGGPPFEDLTVQKRQAESALLHTKGGWRDHTEGNRISTTRGDKIEVIRGNYRRMVLGRQDDSDAGCLLDASGGLYMDGDAAPGSVVLVEYSTKYDGTWKCVEECSKGDVINKYHGDVEEHFYGNNVTAYVGKPGGADWDDSEAIKPTVIEKTWAKTITSETHADDITETTRLTGTMKSDTTVGAGVVDMLAVGAGLVEMVTVGASHIAMEASTSQIELNLAPAHLSVDLSLGMLDLYVGGKIEIAIAKHLAIDVGPRFEMNASTKFKIEPIEDAITPLTNKIAAVENQINNKKTGLAAMHTSVVASHKRISATQKELGLKEMRIKGTVMFL